LTKAYSKKEKHFEDEQRKLERYSLLKVVDEQWKDHLYEMDRLKEGIGLRAYGQRDPLIEYKKESFELFLNLIDTIKEKVIKNVFTLYPALYYQVQDRVKDMQLSHKERNAFDHVASRAEGQRERMQNIPQGQHQPQQQPEESKRQPMRREEEKVGRNDPCPCGSGKKYKHCCGQKG